MSSKKKQWKKAIDQTELLKDLEEFNTQKSKVQALAGMKDEDLFKVAAKKLGVKQEREKLKRDRFRQREQNYTSITEETLLKKQLQRLENKEKLPLSHTQPKKKKDDVEDDFNTDLWNDEIFKAKPKEKRQSYREKSAFVAQVTTPA